MTERLLLVSLWQELQDDRLLRECEWIVVPAHGDRVRRLNAFFDSYRSGDAYDTNAITHVMACTSRFPGWLLRPDRAMA